MANEFDDELKQMLTKLRQVLNKSNKLAIAAQSLQGDFEIEFDIARAMSKAFTQEYLVFVRAEVNPLFIQLGKLLASKDMIRLMGLSHEYDDSYLYKAIEWYEATYYVARVW